ncbi:MAG: class I SAM-dependent methyltransferase [Nocardioides sp.]
MTLWERIARSTAGDDYATTYADRFRALAADGQDTHGEAALVTELAAPPARVLDAGCGTGRIAVRLHELGHVVVGTDVDESMLALARQDAPDLDWRHADLADLDLGERFDVVLIAGNVVPLLEPGTLLAVAVRVAEHLAPGGLVVAGFGLDAQHLPPGCPVTSLDDYERAMAAAGLVDVDRWSTWDRQSWTGGYAVSVHARGRG